MGLGAILLCGWMPAAPPAAKAREHWAFQPLLAPAVPLVKRSVELREPIDAFIEAPLEGAGLAIGPEASREVIIRRLTFDLTGLPPSPEDIDDFLADDAPDACERLVDRLLASPRYGERWGRHWLDAAGHADSNGYFSADSDRPLAFRYRDWVIRAHNEDQPLDRFLLEQLAGDELAGYEPGGDVLEPMVGPLTATGFLRCAQDGTGESDGNEMEVLIDKISVIEGTVQIVGASLLGLTLQCAKCHDHKLEPITQADYYSLQAVFTPAYSTRAWKKPGERAIEVGTRAEREEHRRRMEKAQREIDAWEASQEAAAAPLRKLVRRERVEALAGPAREAAEKALKVTETKEDKRSAEEKALVEKHRKLLDVDDGELEKRFAELARVKAATREAIERLERSRPEPLAAIAALADTDPQPPAHHVLNRGQVNDPGAEVLPAIPAVLCREAAPPVLAAKPPSGRSSGRRLALARWLVSDANPLTPRVLANRVWQHHFGTGIVPTSENLGLSGAPPSHPGLLDFLAVELRRSGGSLKRLHRAICLSAAYRQVGGAPPAADPENRLLSRFPLRRLDAEAVRDAALAAAGELDLRMGGPAVPTQRDRDGQVIVDEASDGSRRRSIYLQQRRTQPLTLLEVFDAPLVVTSCTRRPQSTTPLQSLASLNSEFALRRARALWESAARAADSPDGRIEHAYRRVLGRRPTGVERAACRSCLDDLTAAHAGDAARAGADLCQMLLAANEVIHVD
jgi:hypothetical protein